MAIDRGKNIGRGSNGGEIYRLKRMETLTRKFFVLDKIYFGSFRLFFPLSRSCPFEEN